MKRGPHRGRADPESDGQSSSCRGSLPRTANVMCHVRCEADARGRCEPEQKYDSGQQRCPEFARPWRHLRALCHGRCHGHCHTRCHTRRRVVCHSTRRGFVTPPPAVKSASSKAVTARRRRVTRPAPGRRLAPAPATELSAADAINPLPSNKPIERGLLGQETRALRVTLAPLRVTLEARHPPTAGLQHPLGRMSLASSA